jgi:hypothetical protein
LKNPIENLAIRVTCDHYNVEVFASVTWAVLPAIPGYAQTVPANQKETKMTQAKTVQQNAAAEDKSVRPFRINIPEEALVDLRQRLARTRLPDKETVSQASLMSS